MIARTITGKVNKLRNVTRVSVSAVRNYDKTPDHTKNDNVSESWYQPPHVRVHKYDPNPPKPYEFEDEDVWQVAPSEFEFSRGQERAEYLDATIFDDHLPDIVDIAKYGSSIINPIIVKSHGEHERIVGCFGNCGEPYKIDFEDENQVIKYFRLPEDEHSVCSTCGLHFYCASPLTVAHMRVNELLETDKEVQEQFVIAAFNESVESGDLTVEEADKKGMDALASLSIYREAQRTLAGKKAIEESLFIERMEAETKGLTGLTVEDRLLIAEKVKNQEFDNLKPYLDAFTDAKKNIPSQLAEL